MDYWHSTQRKWQLKLQKVDQLMETESLVYIVNAIDALSDQQPRSVRSARLQYSGMMLAHRWLLLSPVVHDGERCAHIAALALYVAIRSDGHEHNLSDWDKSVAQVFSCDVIHRTCISALSVALPAFVATLEYNLHCHHPWEELRLLSVGDQSLAAGILNSLYRTSAVVKFAPYVLAIAAIVGAMLMKEEPKVDAWLSSLPVSSAAVESVLVDYLFPFVQRQELPPLCPPTLEEVQSPSTRKSVSRQSSRGSKTVSSKSSTKGGSLAWALLEEEDRYSPDFMHRPVSLPELTILRELAEISEIRGIVVLTKVRSNLVGIFDSTGTQFDSVLRLMKAPQDLLTVLEQVLAGAYFLNENKICHFSLEPRNIMITSDNKIKIASLAGAAILPSVPSVYPSMEYRAPELLLGGSVKDDPLGVDLWSLGCLLAEVCRIFATKNRYEEPLFRLNDSLPDKPDLKYSKFPIRDSAVYTSCRYVLQIAAVVDMMPAQDVWPGVHTRAHFASLTALIAYKKKKHSGFEEAKQCSLNKYLNVDPSVSVAGTIVKALLRWCPERRATPQTCLQHLGKAGKRN